MLEYIIGVALAAKGIGRHLDTLLMDTMRLAFMDVAPIYWSALASYFDFFAFVLPMVLACK